MRICEICGAACGDDKKLKNYVVLIVPRLKNEIVACKGCLMRGTHAENGSYILKAKEFTPPALAFPRTVAGNRVRDEYLKAAKAEGWRIGTLEGEAQVIDAHYEQALINNYFAPGVGWKKDASTTSLECFKRSCKNIKNSYASWLSFCQGKEYLCLHRRTIHF